ncbi:hypothetical protein AAMO2058_001079500 [Amorphochlora amoebiformis]
MDTEARFGFEKCTRNLLGLREMGSWPSALFRAIRRGNLRKIIKIIEGKKVSVEVRNPRDGNTPLHKACFYGHMEIIRYLVEEAKADIEARNHAGETMLLSSTYWRKYDVIEYLLTQCKVNIEAKNKRGETPLIKAAQWGDIKIVKLLVGFGAELKPVDDIHHLNARGHAADFPVVVKFLTNLERKEAIQVFSP